MADIKFFGLNKIYPNGVQAVYDFNLEVKDQEFIVFVGPSGCGKSTTLRMVAGLEEISSGELYIDNRLINNVEPKDRDIAMVFQSYALYPHMTVYDNMAFALKLRKTFRPIYLEDPTLQPLFDLKKEIRKQIAKVNRKYKNKQQNEELLVQRDELYKQYFSLLEEIQSKQVQKTGIDEFKIKLKTKELAKANKKVEALENEIKKYNVQLETSPDDEIKKDLNEASEELKIANSHAKMVQEQLQYYQDNEVPLEAFRRPTKEEIDIEVQKAAESIDLVKYLYRRPAALSGGQRQRVALGRAIVRKPKVFLMDEPLSNLDAKLRAQTRSEIIKIHERVGATTIYVTHDQVEAMTMATRIVIMKDGHIKQIGTPKEVYEDPDNIFVGGFIGSPAMNFVDVTYSKGKIVFDDKLSLKVSKDDQKRLEAYEGKQIVLGARPEQIYLADDVNNTNPSTKMNVACDFYELLGHELIIYFTVGEKRMALKTSSKKSVKEGDKLQVTFDLNNLYFFDKDSENRIR